MSRKRDRQLLQVANNIVHAYRKVEGGEPSHRYDHNEPGEIGRMIEWYHREAGSLFERKPLIEREVDE